MQTKTAEPKGFIALVSAVVISTILIGLATAAGTSTFFARFDALNAEYKRVSLGLAEACVHAALAKIGDNYTYTVPLTGEKIDMGGGYCIIKSPTTTPALASGKRTFTITTQGQFKGAFSNVTVSAVAQDPASAPVVPPPACSLAPQQPSVAQGQSITLSWSTSSNATQMSIDHGIGVVTPVASGSFTFTPSLTAGVHTFIGTASNAGGTGTCPAVVTVTPPPAAPSCADSAMMLDRSGSMSSTDLTNEYNAAKKVLDLYSAANPVGWLAVGRFADMQYAATDGYGGHAGISSIGGSLSNSATNYSGLLTAITRGTTACGTSGNPCGGTNIAAAITAAKDELASSAKEKVLLLVSDAEPNEPSDTSGDSGWKSPSSNGQDSSGEAWSNPTGAYSDGGGEASDPVSENDQHRLYGFGFSIPSNANIQGIEVRAEAWATAGQVQNPGTDDGSPASTVTPNQFGSPTNAYTSNNQYATNSTNGQAQGYGNFNLNIPSNATITGIGVTAEARSADSNGCSIGAEVSANNGSSYSSTGSTVALGNSDANRVFGGSSTLWGRAWVPADFANGKFVVRVQNVDPGSSCNNGSTLSVDYVTATVYYTTPAPAPVACQLGVQLSWDGGSNWSSELIQTITGTEAQYVFGSSDDEDDWGSHNWDDSEFSTSNFRTRVRAIDPGSGCDNASVDRLDWLQTRVSYTVPGDPAQAATAAATEAKNAGIQIFGIYFNTSPSQSAQNYFTTLTSPTNLPVSSITTASRSGSTITATTTAPHKLAKNQRVAITGFSDNSFNGTAITVTAVVNASTFRYTSSSSGTKTLGGGVVTATNLFLAPSSSDMQEIFQSIGTQVCPAAAAQCGNTIDDDGDGLIDISDPGCHTDGDASNVSSYDATDGDEWQTLGAPVPPPPPPPPPNISIGSWVETPPVAP